MDLFFVPLVSNYDFLICLYTIEKKENAGLGRAFNIVIVIDSIVEQFIDNIVTLLDNTTIFLVKFCC